MMDEKMNPDLYAMVTLGLIAQDEAEAQYAKIQEMAISQGVKLSHFMVMIAYLTTEGWDFLDVIEGMSSYSPSSKAFRIFCQTLYGSNRFMNFLGYCGQYFPDLFDSYIIGGE